jgi:hypothetical protein
MNLKHLTDKALLVDTKYLVTREREFLTKILHHLKEIDRRRLYSDLKYSSLFEYSVKELGYSESSAQRRIQACRLLADIPEIEKKIEDGLLSLSNLSKAAQFFNEHQISDSDQKKGVLEQLEKLTQKEGDKKLFKISGIPKTPKESKGRVSDKEMRVTLILKDEVMDKLERFKGLIHKPKSNSEIFEMTLDISIPYLIKKKFKSLEKS